VINLKLKAKLEGNNFNPREHIDKIHMRAPISSLLLMELKREEVDWS
jgi:hypothetical protein